MMQAVKEKRTSLPSSQVRGVEEQKGEVEVRYLEWCGSIWRSGDDVVAREWAGVPGAEIRLGRSSAEILDVNRLRRR